MGIGFAIPSNLAGEVMRQLLHTASAARRPGANGHHITRQAMRANWRGADASAVVARRWMARRRNRPGAGARPGAGWTVPIATSAQLRNAEGLLPVGKQVC